MQKCLSIRQKDFNMVIIVGFLLVHLYFKLLYYMYIQNKTLTGYVIFVTCFVVNKYLKVSLVHFKNLLYFVSESNIQIVITYFCDVHNVQLSQ